MKYLTITMAVLFSSINVLACENMIGKWACKYESGDTMLVEIHTGSPYQLKQTKLGISMGPFLLDGNEHNSMDSNNVEMNYQGSCSSNSKLDITVEQIYFAGLKVYFDESFELLDSGNISFTLIDRKPNRAPTKKQAVCRLDNSEF